jgi:hypothetical protein
MSCQFFAMPCIWSCQYFGRARRGTIQTAPYSLAIWRKERGGGEAHFGEKDRVVFGSGWQVIDLSCSALPFLPLPSRLQPGSLS